MNDGLIAARYATALLDFANISAASESVYNEVKAVLQSFSKFSELHSVLDNPVMAKTEKRKIIMLAAGGNVSTTFERFVDLLWENNRENHLQSIMLKYVDLYRKQKNIHSGKLTTATTIELPIEKKLLTLMEKETGGTVELEKIIDPNILGGFLFEVDFVQWDASLSGQLKRIREEYIEQNKRIM